MLEHDEEMERYLGKFQPRAIRQLEIPGRAEKLWMRRMAEAAVLVLAVGVSLWYAHHKTIAPPEIAKLPNAQLTRSGPQARMNTLVLAKLAFEDNTAFDTLLTEASRTALPRMEGQQSALRVLARE